MPRSSNRPAFEQPFVYEEDLSTIGIDVEAFRRRQREDLKRYNAGATTSRQPFRERYRDEQRRDESFASQSDRTDDLVSRRQGWRDSEGDRLDDFGVDEDAELNDEDDLPLADLVRRRHESADNNDGN